MNKLEEFVLSWTGFIITMLGFCGVLLTFFIDEIRVRPFELGWLQMLGICVFLSVMLFGVFTTKFLHQVKEMLVYYLSQ